MFDFLRPTWSARRLTEDDRARRFWLVKASSSYAAWKRCRDRYALFVELMARQCKEEPVGRMGETELAETRATIDRLISEGVLEPSDRSARGDYSCTKWCSSTYAAALEALSLYDQGLEAVKQGDREVFLHQGHSLLERAVLEAERQHTIYCMGGPKGGDGMVFYGKYVPAMKAALLRASEDGFTPWGASTATAQWSESNAWHQPGIERDGTGRKVRLVGTRVALADATAHVKQLGAVPPCSEDITIGTGDVCHVSGVYEPQVRDGMMAYLCQGQKALRYGARPNVPRSGSAVAWRLVWRDTRYADGVIPDEEKDYFPDEAPRQDFSRLFGLELANDWNSDKLVVQRSGEQARYTGIWIARHDLRGYIFWPLGDPLPRHKGVSVEWVYSGA